MAAVNSLLFLLSTISPYTEHPEHSAVTYPPIELNTGDVYSFSKDDDPLYLFPEKKCPSLEWYTCSSHCQRTCENSRLPCRGWCVPGCECIPPLVRGPDGKCIFRYQCPDALKVKQCSEPEDCSENEESEYRSSQSESFKGQGVSFALFIPSRRCSVHRINNRTLCQSSDDWKNVAAQSCLDKTLQLRTFRMRLPCVGGLFKGIHFSCCPEDVPEVKATEQECAPEEEMSCYSHCEKNCTNYNQDIPCPIYCVKGCMCKEPMIRGPEGNCILPENCPSSQRLTSVKQCSEPEECSENKESEYRSSQSESFKRQGIRPPLFIPHRNCSMHRINNRSLCQSSDDWKNVAVQSCLDRTMTLRSFGMRLPCVGGLFKGISFSCCPVDGPVDHIVGGMNPRRTNSGSYKEDLRVAPTSVSFSDVICREDEEYVDCEDTHNDYPSSECVPGCYCKYPLLRSENGACRHKESPSFPSLQSRLYSYLICPEDQVYLFCGSVCEMNCEFYKRKPCVDMCVRGCFCKEPKIFGPNGDCIFPEQCPPNPSKPQFSVPTQRKELLPHLPTLKCGPNEEFALFTTVCPDTCDNYQNERFCKHVRLPGCKCKNGYVVGKEGTCVKIEQCQEQTPSDCSDLEYYDDCGSYCETDCYNYMTDIIAHTCGNKECKKGCFCKPGYVRSAQWECILPQNCTGV